MAKRKEHRYTVKTVWTGAAGGPARDYESYSRAHSIEADGKPPIFQIQEMRRSASFIGTNDPRLHWGVGKHETIERIEVKWLAGETQVFTDVGANALYHLTEGGKLERVR